MSKNVCPPIIQRHWMPELDYSKWAEVAQKHGESFSEPIFPRTDVLVIREEAPGYKAITKAMHEFNEQYKHPEDKDNEDDNEPFFKSVQNSAEEIMEKIKNSRGKFNKSKHETTMILRRLDRAGSARDYAEQLCTPYNG